MHSDGRRIKNRSNTSHLNHHSLVYINLQQQTLRSNPPLRLHIQRQNTKDRMRIKCMDFGHISREEKKNSYQANRRHRGCAYLDVLDANNIIIGETERLPYEIGDVNNAAENDTQKRLIRGNMVHVCGDGNLHLAQTAATQLVNSYVY
eukprot:261955_1